MEINEIEQKNNKINKTKSYFFEEIKKKNGQNFKWVDLKKKF